MRALPAQIAAFVRRRCELAAQTEARAYLCEACEHVFLTPLLTEQQLDKLYDDYRGPKYNQERIGLEPDYAAIAADFADVDGHYYGQRRAFYDEFHAGRFDKRGLIVDASDGSGYFARYAYPFADVITLPKVGAVPGLELESLLAQADVLMMTHSLQGAPDPLRALKRLSDGLRPGAGVWIETPVQYSGALRAAFAVQEARFARGLREYGPLQTLHENLAHFSVLSLRRLLSRAGLSPLEFVRSSIGILGVWAQVQSGRSGIDPNG